MTGFYFFTHDDIRGVPLRALVWGGRTLCDHLTVRIHAPTMPRSRVRSQYIVVVDLLDLDLVVVHVGSIYIENVNSFQYVRTAVSTGT